MFKTVTKLSMLAAAMLLGSVSVFAQVSQKAVTLNVRGASLSEVIKSVEKQTGCTFSFRDAAVQGQKEITLNVNSVPLTKALDEIFRNTNLEYQIVDDSIVLREKQTPRQENGPEITVRGTVKDALGEPLIGAYILIKGTQTGTTAAVDGSFELKAPAGAALEISCIGYTTQEVAASANLDIRMKDDMELLESTVVIGYGVQKKSDVTGSVARVGADEIRSMPVKNALEGMQGKVAGVDITSSMRPGEVGSIKNRGVRSLSADQDPLYVVDGMVLQNEGGISTLNPSDIESIDILKDASATAIYGSRGANGVVLITTKSGKSGKVSLNYSGSVTFEQLRDITKYMTAAEWLNYARMAAYKTPQFDNNGQVIADKAMDSQLWGSVPESWANIEKAYDANGNYDASKVGEYDWMKHAYQLGISHEHTLSVSGGTDKFKGYASFGYLNTRGTQKGQGYERYNGKASFEATPLPFFTMGASLIGAYGLQEYGTNMYSALRRMLPWSVPFDSEGNFIRLPSGDTFIVNPILEPDYNISKRNTATFNGNFYASMDFGKVWEPLEGLSYRIQFGPEFRFYENGSFVRKGSVNSEDKNTASWNQNKNISWTLDNLIYYNKQLGRHTFNLTLMQSASKYYRDYMNGSNSNVALESELWYNIGSPAETGSFGSGLTRTQMASYMGRINYNFNDRYLLTASIRWDGSSVLASGHKWASFPSVALGWRIDKEDFMSSASAVNMLKLRLGVGVTGNSAISAYSTLGSIQSLYYHWGNKAVLGYLKSDSASSSPLTLANQELGWEKTTQWNLGLDYGFLHNRINGSLDVYSTKTDDLLMSMLIPSLTGYTRTFANVGETSGWGIDYSLNASPISTADFNWNISATWSLDRSKIVALANGNEQDITNRWFVGEEIGVYYDYVYGGVWKTAEAAEAEKYGRTPGQIRIVDINNDGTIDAKDRQIVGTTRPRWIAGLTNTFSYKNFDLSVFMISRWGFNIANGAEDMDGRYMKRSIDFFVPGYNEDAEYYQPGVNGQSIDAYKSAMNYKDGSFIKVRNISLGYNFDDSKLSAAKISSLKLYLQVQNPFIIYSACDYLDTDFNSNISPRSFVFGVNIGF